MDNIEVGIKVVTESADDTIVYVVTAIESPMVELEYELKGGHIMSGGTVHEAFIQVPTDKQLENFAATLI